MAIAAENIMKSTIYHTSPFLTKMLMSAIFLAGHIPFSLSAKDAKF